MAVGPRQPFENGLGLTQTNYGYQVQVNGLLNTYNKKSK